MSQIKIDVPFQDIDTIKSLRPGDRVLLSGSIYTARDAAHKRMEEQLKRNENLPIELQNQVIYYVGPTPAKPGEIIGSAGPTTSSRMDKYTPLLLEKGLKGMIGKGYRSQTVIDSIVNNCAVYFAAIGGSGALLARRIKSVEVIAYEDLGTEAIRKLELIDFPCMVINDSEGRDWYKESQEAFKKSSSKT
ncbi:Fe-S-containing hydro-lyase [Oceanobacillus kimchii]|uniref:Fe-S-containing hydro-lyase n=1 Tax=Oceanobacillus kimchii TaxID=746691 RepID=UPI0003462D7E|nr:Fe-S-containing hydro-lyase [Oceanobacillus kimchii]MCT1578358.1 Fe-S-containing hydro-lyase [Oceanobacillus kimchii]MCT2134536.1 Fe-S-containing hydro-lyase [Oceanobacillus kimchii]